VYRCYSFISMIVLLWSIAGAGPVAAQEKPFQISLFTPVQIIPEDTAIKGIRINLIYGRNAAVKGIDLGLINHTIRGQPKAGNGALLV